MLDQILISLGGAAILVGAAAWLTRSIVLHFLSKDFEIFKQQLANQSASEVARLKHSLQITASEHEKRTALLLERRAEVIAELYRRLVEFLAGAESFAAIGEFGGEPTKPEKAKILGKKAFEFHSFFVPNRIYFSENTCANVDELFRGVWKSTSSLRIWWELKEQHGSATSKMLEAWQETSSFIKEKVPPLMSGVEREFREMLGVASSIEPLVVESNPTADLDARKSGARGSP